MNNNVNKNTQIQSLVKELNLPR